MLNVDGVTEIVPQIKFYFKTIGTCYQISQYLGKEFQVGGY